MRRFLTLGFLATVSIVSALFAVTPPDAAYFAHEHSDLKADPAARFGKLPNGLRYVVMASHEPKDRASLRLVVFAGSFHENDDQRGLAHFLEHVAFNGSTHYAPGTLVEFFQRMGMSFGGDTNAYTSFDHTAYMLELPNTKSATLDEGFRVFADYAGGLLLLESSINKERGIILSEKRARDSVEYRQHVAKYEFLFGSTRFPKRMPIGEASVIENAQRERFTDFYNTWYRPERMAVIAVGDFDPAEIEKKITDTFGPLAPHGSTRPAPDLGRPDDFTGVRTLYHHEPEAGATSVSVQTVTPVPVEADTSETRLKYLPRELAVLMLNRRLEILAKAENAPFSNGDASVHDEFKLFRASSIDLTCKPGQWPAALAVAEQELRRAIEHGFQEAELQEARANIINILEQADKTASTRRSPEVTQQLIQALTDDEVFTTPADDLALYRPAVEKATTAQCTEALRAAFSAPGRFVSVMGNVKIDTTAGASPDAQILAAYEKARAVAVAAPKKTADAAFAYTDFGPAGKVTSHKHVDDLDLELVSFANNVRLNIKKTSFEAGKIRTIIRVGGGRLTEPKNQPGLSLFTRAVFTTGGLGKHSFDEVQRILAGRTVSATLDVNDDAFVMPGITNRDDLLLQFRLAAAYITDPGFRPEALRVAQQRLDQTYTRIGHLPEGPLQLEVPRLLANGDTRFGLPAREEIFARTLDESRAWLGPQFASGPIEIGVIGDLDVDQVIDVISRTFGALPARQPKPAYEAERKATFPAQPFTKNYTVPSELPKGIVAVYWPTTDATDIRLKRRLDVLAEVFSDRLRVKIREELGDAYSPEAGNSPSDTYRGYGYTAAYITVDPAKAQIVTDAVLEVADALAKNGLTEDEFERAKMPILTGIREAVRSNGNWLQVVLAAAQEYPQRLDWRRSIESDFAAISKSELDVLAKQYLPATRAFRVTSLPQKP
ncbi:MAG: insulinase family protein [Nibricoccus sp.]